MSQFGRPPFREAFLICAPGMLGALKAWVLFHRRSTAAVHQLLYSDSMVLLGLDYFLVRVADARI